MQNPSKITKNNSQGIIFVIISWQRVLSFGESGSLLFPEQVSFPAKFPSLARNSISRSQRIRQEPVPSDTKLLLTKSYSEVTILKNYEFHA